MWRMRTNMGIGITKLFCWFATDPTNDPAVFPLKWVTVWHLTTFCHLFQTAKSFGSADVGAQTTRSPQTGRNVAFNQQQHFYYLYQNTGFVQKSDCGFPDFSRTKLLLFSRLFKAFCEQNISKLAFKC